MSSRTPKYPSIGLTKALESVRKLWAAEKRSPFPPEEGVKAMGFKSLSGGSRPHLASLKQYGLIESAGKDALKITPLGISIVAHAEGTKEQDAAIQEAALNPPLFRDLFDVYKEASDGTIRAFLITKKDFSEDAAKNAVKAFRDTISLAKLDENDLNPSLFDDNIDDVNETETDTDKAKQVQSQGQTNLLPNQPPLAAGGTRVIIDIPSEGEVKISFTGNVNMKTFAFVNGILDLQKQMFPENTKKEEETSKENSPNYSYLHKSE